MGPNHSASPPQTMSSLQRQGVLTTLQGLLVGCLGGCWGSAGLLSEGQRAGVGAPLVGGRGGGEHTDY